MPAADLLSPPAPFLPPPPFDAPRPAFPPTSSQPFSFYANSYASGEADSEEPVVLDGSEGRGGDPWPEPSVQTLDSDTMDVDIVEVVDKTPKRRGAKPKTKVNKKRTPLGKFHKKNEETPEERERRIKREEEEHVVAVNGYVNSLKQFNDAIAADGADLVNTVVDLIEEMLDELTFEIVVELHRKFVTGDIDIYSDNAFVLPTNDRYDIFGVEYNSYRIETFLCDNNCGRSISSNRYAPHLEKCTGLHGKKAHSMRRATRTRAINYAEEETVLGDSRRITEIEEIEEVPPPPPPKRERKLVVFPEKAGDEVKVYFDRVRAKPKGELELFLSTKCGVISRKTGKMCTKTHNCPQHDTAQRNLIRDVLLNKMSIEDAEKLAQQNQAANSDGLASNEQLLDPDHNHNLSLDGHSDSSRQAVPDPMAVEHHGEV